MIVQINSRKPAQEEEEYEEEEEEEAPGDATYASSEDPPMLVDYGIRNGATLYLELRLRGGAWRDVELRVGPEDDETSLTLGGFIDAVAEILDGSLEPPWLPYPDVLDDSLVWVGTSPLRFPLASYHSMPRPSHGITPLHPVRRSDEL